MSSNTFHRVTKCEFGDTLGMGAGMDKQRRILVVEDEPIASLELQETLGKGGYEVSDVLDSGDQVIQSVIRNPPDLILMDIKLKSFNDGIDVIRRLKLIRDTPVLFITAYNTPDMRTRAQALRPLDYLVKPVDESQLLKSLERCFS